MTPEQFQRLEMLYDRAAALPEGERTRFIEEQCAGNEELRSELMALFRDAGSGLTGLVKQAAAAAYGSEDHRTAHRLGEEHSQMARPPQIGPYELVKEIGRGAMGVVFLAFDPAIGRAVAIKIIRSDPFARPAEKDELRRRFGREAGAAGKLSHPGIVTVHHLGSDDDQQYMVMELVSGQCLEKLLVQGTPVEIPKVTGILRQLAAALDYAHSQGVIHRDIKPANILVSPDGAVKLGDFGIARVLSSTMTLTGAVLGTPSYMAPEQIMARKVGAGADQFSLAVLAYQMLTGHRPFEASSSNEVMYQILHAEPHPVRAANPALPAALEDVFLRALSKDPDQRYGSCTEFVTALERQLAGPRREPRDLQPEPPAATQDLIPRALNPDAKVRPSKAADCSTELEGALHTHVVKKAAKLSEFRWKAWMLAPIVAIGATMAVAWWHAAKRGPVSAPAEVPMHSFYYWILGQPDGGSERRLMHEMLFPTNYRIAVMVRATESGHLYVVNEGPAASGKTTWNTLFPSPSSHGGSSALTGGSEVRIPEARYFRFDSAQGTENLWLIWSSRGLPELEMLQKWIVQSRGEVQDEGNVQYLKQLTRSISVEARRDEANGLTIISHRGDPVLYDLKLEHN